MEKSREELWAPLEKLGTCLLILKDLSASVEIKAVWSYTVQKKLFLKAAKCLSKPILDFESLVTEYRAGNSAVTEIVNRAAEMFGIGIANIAYLFNPGVVVVGGSYKKLGDSFLDQVNRTVRRHIYPLFYQNIGLQFSALEHDSCLIGIAAVVFDRLLKKPSFLLDH